MRVAVAVAVLLLTAATLLGGGAEASAAVPLVHRLPVDGAVVRPFVAPATRFGSGHRGVDLAGPVGTTVRASASGRVGYAGSVAGATWVSVDHPDGVRTSYGPLGTRFVRAGQRVDGGDALGTTGALGPHPGEPPGVHWSARRHGSYLDPLSLVRDEPWIPTLVGSGGWQPTDEPSVPWYSSWDGRHRFGVVPGSPRADGPGWATAPNPNHVIGVAGLGSRTGQPPLRLTDLGYSEDAVTYLSYAGPGEGSGPDRDQAAYGPEHTWEGVAAAALRLRDQLRVQWQREPGVAVDLVGHSMGGVVILWYLLTLHDPADPTLPPISHVATIASPLEGADLANALVDRRDGSIGRLLLPHLPRVTDQIDASASSLDDLAAGSGPIEHIGERWRDAVDAPLAGPLATGTRVLTMGADADIVVPEHRSDLPDAPHVVLPGTHDGVRRTEASRIALRAFLADAPVPGEAGGLGHWLSYPLGLGSRLGLDLFLDPRPVPSW